MRVLHWYPNFLGGGATANAALGLANAQARLGAKVAIATARPLKAPLYGSIEKKISSVELIRWNPAWVVQQGSFVFRRLPRRARGTLTQWNPDVVHIHGEFNTDNLRVPTLFDCPVVLSPHGAFAPQVFSKSRKALKRVYFQLAWRFLYRHVAAFHALCPMEETHISGVLPGVCVYQVPQGPNVEAQPYVPSHLEESQPESVTFLFVGRLDVFTKGLDALLDAFAEAERVLGNGHIYLTLVGPDWNGGMEQLRRRAAELGIADRVAFTGSLLPIAVNTEIRKADIYIQLSRHDGFPLSVVEALLAAKPAILSNNIGTISWPELASLPYVRIVSSIGRDTVDAMVEFVRRLAILKPIAAQYQASVSEFLSWERAARQHLDAYRRLGAPC
jgi:glycosyltransferase involved in cell wall biosynthesis